MIKALQSIHWIPSRFCPNIVQGGKDQEARYQNASLSACVWHGLQVRNTTPPLCHERCYGQLVNGSAEIRRHQDKYI